MDFLHTLDVLGLLQGTIFSAVLLYRAYIHRSRLYLFIALHLFTYTIEIVGTLLVNYTDQYPSMISLPFNFYFLTPVLLLVYTRVLIDPAWQPSHKLFLPGAIEFLVLTVLFCFPAEIKVAWLNDSTAILVNQLYVIASACYVVFIYSRILIFVRQTRRVFTSSQVNLQWVALSCYAMFVTLALWIVLNLLPLAEDHIVFFSFNAALGVTNDIYIYFVCISGITQLPFVPVPRVEKTELAVDPELQKIFKAKLKIIADKRLYREPELTLAQLASEVKVHPKVLSKVINQCAGENFYQFINRRRVEEAKQMLLNNQYNHLSILGIGMEAGFNSKSTFNAVFKKLSGLTPREFQEQYLSIPQQNNVTVQ